MADDDLIAMLLRHEGMKLRAYRDSLGILTIGVGRNIETYGITRKEAMYLLLNDIDGIRGQLDTKIPWWRTLDKRRQDALVDMAFMGVPRLLGFTRMLDALQKGDYSIAADEAMRSKWARQVKDRAPEIANILRKG